MACMRRCKVTLIAFVWLFSVSLTRKHSPKTLRIPRVSSVGEINKGLHLTIWLFILLLVFESNHKLGFLNMKLGDSHRQLTSAIVRPFQWVIINLGNIHFYNISICLFKLLLCTKVEIGEINSQSQYKDDYKSSLFIGLLGNETLAGGECLDKIGRSWKYFVQR